MGVGEYMFSLTVDYGRLVNILFKEIPEMHSPIIHTKIEY